ncbi:Iron-sulfur cluster regulator IscR [Desulfurella amilsii]|uniref:Iron-sulfur cluster regulator IscR n=1 Tax=Desulfurella amilsii TaxID=1562698 RepID=A0A1X4XV09_9BACT|nr:Rrf2 family transcriptional regulator [Desulfurella amilsii]OSS41348.1 Iron-sulfur cluster regulator IscR [Desulfurella amilsii]
MFLPTNVRYSLRFLIELKKTNEPISLKKVSQITKISENYLKQLAAKLERHGIVEGKKGPHGGYKILKTDVSLKDLIGIFTEGIKLAPCVQGDFVCTLVQNCPSTKMWQEANKAIEKLFEDIKLENF